VAAHGVGTATRDDLGDRRVARAGGGSRFSGYAGSGDTAGCGAAAQCSFMLNGDATVTAAFHAMTSIAVTPSPGRDRSL
jgi:hypothetical protein